MRSLYDYCLENERFSLLAQWDKEKNGALTARDVSYGSHKKVWWACGSGHSWEASVYTRAGANAGCPYCSGKRLSPTDRTLALECPDLTREWHPVKNNGLTPGDVLPSAHRKVWWVCEKGHEWQAQIRSRTAGTGCPVCTNRKVVPGENDLLSTHPALAAQWHPTKNGPYTPRQFVAGNHRKVWWQCEKGHEWQAEILARTKNNNGCPVCAGKKVVPGENDLKSMFPKVAAQWHPLKNGKKTPQHVSAYSNCRAWWVCKNGHEYRAVVALRTGGNTDCPYCSNRKALAGFNDLATKYPKIAAQWHPELNGSLLPQMVTPGSGKKVWWLCGEGHVWKAVIYSRTGKQQCGCPVCAGKTKGSTRLRYADIVTV